jgi:hypothetical protein
VQDHILSTAGDALSGVQLAAIPCSTTALHALQVSIDVGFGHKILAPTEWNMCTQHLEYLLCVHMMDGHFHIKCMHLDEKY